MALEIDIRRVVEVFGPRNEIIQNDMVRFTCLGVLIGKMPIRDPNRVDE